MASLDMMVIEDSLRCQSRKQTKGHSCQGSGVPWECSLPPPTTVPASSAVPWPWRCQHDGVRVHNSAILALMFLRLTLTRGEEDKVMAQRGHSLGKGEIGCHWVPVHQEMVLVFVRVGLWTLCSWVYISRTCKQRNQEEEMATASFRGQ